MGVGLRPPASRPALAPASNCRLCVNPVPRSSPRSRLPTLMPPSTRTPRARPPSSPPSARPRGRAPMAHWCRAASGTACAEPARCGPAGLLAGAQRRLAVRAAAPNRRAPGWPPLAPPLKQGDCGPNDPYIDYAGAVRCLLEGAGAAPWAAGRRPPVCRCSGLQPAAAAARAHSPWVLLPCTPTLPRRRRLHQARHRPGGGRGRQQAGALGHQEEGERCCACCACCAAPRCAALRFAP